MTVWQDTERKHFFNLLKAWELFKALFYLLPFLLVSLLSPDVTCHRTAIKAQVSLWAGWVDGRRLLIDVCGEVGCQSVNGMLFKDPSQDTRALKKNRREKRRLSASDNMWGHSFLKVFYHFPEKWRVWMNEFITRGWSLRTPTGFPECFDFN